MLKRLHLKNFTVFADADFEFSPGLNVLVGTNGTGKSHVLKVGYAVEVVREQVKNGHPSFEPVDSSESKWGKRLLRYLPELFQTFLVTPLISDRLPVVAAFVEADFQVESGLNEHTEFEIHPPHGAIGTGGGDTFNDTRINAFAPVLIPAKEILTLSWMLPASEQLVLPIEQNYLHLLRQLQGLPRRQRAFPEAIEELEKIIGGEIQEVNGKYYLIQKDGQRLGISMVAEGFRKFGTLQKLLANGSLTKQTTLYWDEPEANLNPALLRQLAAILAELARQGFQIILATHSMSLLKEFHILSRDMEKGKLPIKYFSLSAEPGQPTTVAEREDFKYLPNVTALDVELDQADELEEIFARENRQVHADNN